jgi:hypothetical protein
MEALGLLLAAVFGAASSGSVQAGLAYADRGRSGRSACRLVFVQLHGAQSAVNDLRELRDWDQMITDWEAYGHAWDKYSDAIVQVLDTDDSATIGSAFECLASLGRGSARASDVPSDKLLHRYVEIIDKARMIALRKSFKRREREKRDLRVTQAEIELPIAPLASGELPAIAPPPTQRPATGEGDA